MPLTLRNGKTRLISPRSGPGQSSAIRRQRFTIGLLIGLAVASVCADDRLAAASDQKSPPIEYPVGKQAEQPAESRQFQADGAVASPARRFVAGSSTEHAEPHSEDAVDAGESCISDLWVDRTEVANADYQRCVATGACRAREPDAAELSSGSILNRMGDSPRLQQHLRGPVYPAVGLSHADALAYCAWSGGRLPTVDEWRWIASSRGRRGPYPWGAAEPDCKLLNVAIFNEDGERMQVRSCHGGPIAVTQELGDQTEQGVLHMAGNVQEYSSSERLTLMEGSGLVSRVQVLGSAWCWNAEPINKQVPYAATAPKGNRGGSVCVGFRCVYDRDPDIADRWQDEQ